MNETTISTIDTCLVLHLCTKNDVNGNPRRLYVKVLHGSPVDVIKEGHEGIPASIEGLPIIRVNVPHSEYKRWLKLKTKP